MHLCKDNKGLGWDLRQQEGGRGIQPHLAPSSGSSCRPGAQQGSGPRALVLALTKTSTERTWGRAKCHSVHHVFLFPLQLATGWEQGLKSLGRGRRTSRQNRMGVILVASSMPTGPRDPVNNDEAQAHGHQQEAKGSKTKGLWGQKSGSGLRSGQPPHPHTSTPTPRPFAPGFWG